MQARALLLSFLAFTGLGVASERKAALSLYPPWTTLFEGDMVTLVCDVPDSAEAWYTWYRDSRVLTTERGKYRYPLLSAKSGDSGKYSCEAFGSARSDPVSLIVSNDWVILQAPYSAVFEGETVTLRCLGWKGFTVSSIRFYKDEQRIMGYQDQHTLSIPHARVIDDSGTYTCEMELVSVTYIYKSAAVHISVIELFPSPVMEVKPSASPVEGSSVSLMCKIELAAQRRHTKLLFTFYKDWQVLVQRSDSPEYNIKEAGLKNSGEYFCQVETENLSLTKSSIPVQIHIQSSRSPAETLSSLHIMSQPSTAPSPVLPPKIPPATASLPDETPPPSISVTSLVPPAGSLSFLAEVHFCSSSLGTSGKAEQTASEENENIKESLSRRDNDTIREKCKGKQLRVFCEGIFGQQVKKNPMEEYAQGEEIPVFSSIKNLVRAIQEQKTAFESVVGRDSTEARPTCATNSSLLEEINQSVQGLNTDVGKVVLEVQTMNGHLASIANSLRQIARSLTKDPLDVPT